MAEVSLHEGQVIAWEPQPRQARALSCPADIIFYGGAAGGGKSDFLLMDFTKGLKYGSDQIGIIFRQTYKQLEQLIKRSKELYPVLGAKWAEGKGLWTFPGGSTVKFRHLEMDKDVEEYQGHEYTYIAFDELTHWKTEYCFIYMLTRNRSPSGVPCFLRAAGNPGGKGHAWVKNMFIDGKEPEKLYTERFETSQGIVETTSVFIPAKLTDNYILMKNDPKYEANLMKQPPHIRKALLDGDWDVFIGQVFDEFKRERHVIKPIALRPEWRKFASFDWGYAKPFSLGFWGVTTEGRMIRYREWYGCEKDKQNSGLRMPPNEVAEKSFNMGVAEGCRDIVMDPACWITTGMKDDKGNEVTVASKFQEAGWITHKAVNKRILGKVRFHEFLKIDSFDGRPMMLIFNTCLAFIRTIPVLTVDPKNPEDIDSDLEDHVYDEARYACMSDLANKVVKIKDRWETHTAKNWEVEEYDPLGRAL